MEDEVFTRRQHLQAHDGDLTYALRQPSEDIIIARNAELRKSPGAIRDLGGSGTQSWGRMIATIPLILLEKAKKDGYDLFSRNPDLAQRELLRFLQSPEGKACLVTDNTLKTQKFF